MKITIEKLERINELNPGISNATGGAIGYRFKPNGMKFAKAIKVTIPFDKDEVRDEKDLSDLYTYFYDEEKGIWEQLERVAVDEKEGLLTSLTTHFTDMINGVLKLPESPTPLSFNPNSIKDIKAADPGTGINLIEAPQANPQGTANLQYPIEVPPGRNGMQPQITVNYNSDGGNGWMGIGWDIGIQAVTIDTRWGVPRYDNQLETETYMLEGMQLTPLAHRGELKPRSSEKVFHSRIEGSFRKIIRHGSSPANYWWEVTDKKGTKYFYGGTPEHGQDLGSCLTTSAGCVFQWGLVQVRDTNGNTIDYDYAKITDDCGTGDGTGAVKGIQLYLKTISYTGTIKDTGPYVVTFIRDRDLRLQGINEPRRPDVMIDARNGAKVVTSDLLRKIEIKFNSSMIRSYEFIYKEGAFKKELLTDIIQYGSDGTEFNRHKFEYYNDIQNDDGTYKGFAPSSTWNIGSNNIFVPLLEPVSGTLLGTTKGTTTGWHVYTGIGYGPTKDVSGGFKVGGSNSDSEDIVTMVDLNGDGLPDKVFKQDSGLVYRPNLGPADNPVFGSPVSLNISSFSVEHSDTSSFGAEAYAYGGNLMKNNSKTHSYGKVYFSDVNGDGLPDLVNNGAVLFNRLVNGTPTFRDDSSGTPVQIDSGIVDLEGIGQNNLDEYNQILDNCPLIDGVRCWRAPFSGKININAPVRLVQIPRGDYKTADGVRVAIQKNGTELWSASIGKDDYNLYNPSGVNSVTVTKGDRIYFRVNSIYDGAYDQVEWDPEINYLNVPSDLKDVNGLNPYRYKASEDFVYAGRGGDIQAPIKGTIRILGDLQKTGTLSDDIRLIVYQNGNPILTKELKGDVPGSITLDQFVNVEPLDKLRLKLESDSPVDLKLINWNPKIYYTAATDPNIKVIDNSGKPLFILPVFYDADLYSYNALDQPQDFWEAPQDGTIRIIPRITVTSGNNLSSTVCFTVKKSKKLLGKLNLAVSSDQTATGQIEIPVVKGERLYFDFNSRNPQLIGFVSQSVQVYYSDWIGDPQYILVPSEFHSTQIPNPNSWPQTYRGWGYLAYNGNLTRYNQPINESELVIDKNYGQNEVPKVFLMCPQQDDGKQQWGSEDDGCWIKPGTISSSRRGSDYIVPPGSESSGGARGIIRKSYASQSTGSLGYSVATVSTSKGDSFGELDFLDMNGDRFPDIVGTERIQYTTMGGGLESNNSVVPGYNKIIRRSSNYSEIGGIGGNPPLMVPNSLGEVGGSTKGSSKHLMSPLGLTYNFVDNEHNESKRELVDINGDGLPDQVWIEGSDIMVSLNLGYKFTTTAEKWGSSEELNKTRNVNPPLQVNLSFNTGNYGFAGGISYTCSRSEELKSLIDINSDGLPDLVTKDRETMYVALNTGQGFMDSVAWPGALNRPVSETANTQMGGGAYFTYSIWIPFTPLFAIFNPGADGNTSAARREAALMDVNGDGCPDHVESTSDGSMTVALNQIGRTNKLKTVTRPLGATLQISYAKDGNTYDMPQQKWVMDRVEINDGHTGDGVDTQVTTFRYSGGKQDRYEREFFGYHEVVSEFRDPAQNDSIYKTFTRKYHNDSYYNKGLVESETIRDGNGRIYTEVINQYVLWDVDTRNILVNLRPFNAEHTVFPQLRRADRRFYEGQPNYGAWTYETFEYDKYGNVTRYCDAGDPNANDDDVQANIDYMEDLTRYIVEKPANIRVYGNGALMRERQGDYDTAGNMTELRQYLANGQAQITNFSYYANGNLKEVTGPPNQSNQRYKVTLEYDPVVNTHITKIKDSFEYVSTSSYDYLFGVEINSTDLNGNPMRKVYDNFGRLKQLFAPYDTNIPAVQFEYYHDEFPARAVTKNKIYFDPANSETLDTVIIIDGLKRVIQTKKNGEVLPAGTTSARYGMNVTGKVIFDAMGRTWQQGQPVFQEGYDTNFFNNIPLKNPTVNQYDILDRTVQVTLPDGSKITTLYSIESGLFKTAVTDPENKVKHSFQDINGNTVKTEQFNTGKTITTTYDYDPLDQIVKITDDHNNITRMTYDFVGQRTSIESPDSGLVEYTYDMAGNLIRKVDANLRDKNQAINYLYEYNRLKKIDYPVSTDVEYYYGAPGADENRAGRIAKVIDESGTTEFSYGKLGEVVLTKKDMKFLVPGHSPWKFMTHTSYDYLGRIQRITYPDGERLTYVYDKGGQIKSVSGKKQNDVYEYVKQIGYDEFGQRVYIKYGNDVETRYTYDPYRRWLANINTRNSYNTTFQDLKYSFDRVGNVLSIENQARNVSQNFQYDDLYQLVTAKGFADDGNKRNEYHQTFTYDTIGNITKKTSYNHLTPGNEKPNVLNYTFNYLYNGTKPHAPNQIGNWVYTYDANGNVIKKVRLAGSTGNSSQNDRKDNGNDKDKEDKSHGKRDGLAYGREDLNENKNKAKKDPPGQGGRSDSDIEGGGTSGEYFWDEENRLVEAKNDGNGKSTYFLYDYKGDRTIKRGQHGETLYVNEYYQLQNQNIITKHIFVGSTRIVSKLTHYSNYDSNYEKKNTYTYHPDHLGSSNFVTDPEGKEFEHMEYTPYGESWVDEGTNKNVIGYRFTSKELDTETGLYYFGARYLYPLTSRWISPDPAFEKYLPEAPVDDEARERNSRLPSKGIVFNPLNLDVYHYAGNNPTKYVDPDGNAYDIVDVGFAAWSWADFINNPTWENAGWALLDTVSLLPIVPSTGYIRRGIQVGSKLDNFVHGGKIAGEWIQATEHMSSASRAYQRFITGTDKVFLLNGVKFDGLIGKTLVEAKGSYKNFVNKATGAFYNWFRGAQGLIDQAQRQLKAAKGNKIIWYFADEVSLNAVKALFKQEGIQGIELVLKALK